MSVSSDTENKKYYAVRASFPNRFLCDNDLETLGIIIPDPDQLTSVSLNGNDIVWLLSACPNISILQANLKNIIEIGLWGDIQDVPNLAYDVIDDCDWLDCVYDDDHAPLKIGSFFIHGQNGTNDCPKNMFPIQMDAVHAFGAGTHATTQGCLEVLETIKITPKVILDVGTGSGILSIAAQKIWPDVRGVCTDICEESIGTAHNHFSLNNCANHFQLVHTDGLTENIIQTAAPYDMAIANILPVVLRVIADDIAPLIAKDGLLLLSGIIDADRKNIVDQYTALGFEQCNIVAIDGWNTILFVYRPS